MLCAQGTVMVWVGAAVTEGAIVSQADYPPMEYPVTAWEHSPARGQGMQVGFSYVHGHDPSTFRPGIGFRVDFRHYREEVLTTTRIASWSSFQVIEYAYGGIFNSREVKFAMPLSAWFRLSSHSRITAGIEFQMVWAQGFEEEGTVTITTDHYTVPDYEFGGTTVREGPSYENEIDAKNKIGARFGAFLGYRYRFNDRFMVGPDAAVVGDPLAPEKTTSHVPELTFSLVWTFNTPGKSKTP